MMSWNEHGVFWSFRLVLQTAARWPKRKSSESITKKKRGKASVRFTQMEKQWSRELQAGSARGQGWIRVLFNLCGGTRFGLE